MVTANAQPLDYATSNARFIRSRSLRFNLGICAVAGLLVNFALILGEVVELHRTAWVYHDLMQNPQAFGRDIALTTITTLRDTYLLRISGVATIVAAAFGMLLALHLLVAVMQMDHKPGASFSRLRQYRLWKPIGIVATVAALWWGGTVSFDFWVAATSHIPLGSTDPLPPILENGAFILCALLPWWWARERRAT